MNEFACDVRAGLSKPRKELPSKYLYDELGSALFETITVLPEYGLARADQRLLERYARDIPREFALIAEFGSGTGRKTRAVLDALDVSTYFPIDVSAAALDRCRTELKGLVRVEPIEASYLEGLDCVPRSGRPVLVLFLGGTIGNFDPSCRAEFLRQVRMRLYPGDAMLVGYDLVKDPATMLRAYDDPTGVTAAFNLNLLGRINRELGGDFDLRAFAHSVQYDPIERRIEMHLHSLAGQSAWIEAARFRAKFGAGETIWTESSHKFDAAEIPAFAREAGFVSEAQWIDREWPFAENLWRAV